MKRRDFLKTSGLAAAGLSVARGAQAAGDDCIKIGLVGCGGRARGAVQNRLSFEDNCKVVAICDAFEQNAKNAAEAFRATEDERYTFDDDHVFWGFEAYKNVIDSCDQVLIVTTPADDS